MSRILLPVLLLLGGCFSAPNTQPLADGVAAMDSIHEQEQLILEKLVAYGVANQMPADTAAVYRVAMAKRARDFERIRLASLMAIAELADIPLSELLTAVERGATIYLNSRQEPRP